jgi:hypothetical protein
MIARQASNMMATREQSQKSYPVIARLIFRRGRIIRSRIVSVGEFETFEEANRAAWSVGTKELKKKYKSGENGRLVEIRAEVFIRTEQGEHRIRSRVLNVAPVSWK